MRAELHGILSTVLRQVASGTCENSAYSGTRLFLSLVRSTNLILDSHWNEDHRRREKKN